MKNHTPNGNDREEVVSAEENKETIPERIDEEHSTEESFIRNWFKELKMDLKKVLVIIIVLIFCAGYRVVL